MSGLEIVASIAGVATAAIKISVSMNDVAEDLGSAGRDVRYISNEMASFSQVLRLVHSSLEDSTKVVGSSVVQSALNTLPQLIEQCGLVHEEANGLMVSLKPSEGKESSLPFVKRVRFLFQKSRITVLRSLLDSSKSTLNLLLVTLNIEMAKLKTPSKQLMDQLQSERKAFIRVVASQSRALDDALKEVEKAKKETAKLKAKAEKGVKKDQAEEKDAKTETIPRTTDTGSTLKVPPMYTLPAPSVSQLVYTPPSTISTAPQMAFMSLALSQEPAYPNSDASTPRSGEGSYSSFYTPAPPSPPPPAPQFFPKPNKDQPSANTQSNRPDSARRVFSDPGPAEPRTTSSETLHPGGQSRERARSPYGFSRVPKDNIPETYQKRSSPNFQQASSDEFNPGTATSRESMQSPKCETRRENSAFQTNETSSKYGNRKPSQPPSEGNFTPCEKARYQPKVPPPPPPIHGATYVALSPHSSRDIGHLDIKIFDVLVDVVSYTPEEEDLPYPADFDNSIQPKHYWQASLHHRRGPRGLIPADMLYPIDDKRVRVELKENWFSDVGGFIADNDGRIYVGPEWTVVG